MNKPTKVVIEVTAEGWSERVYSGLEVIAEKRNVTIPTGDAEHEGDYREWHEMLPCLDRLSDAMDDIAFGPFRIARALHEISEDCQ